MIIEIERTYLNSGLVAKVMINTAYVLRIEETHDSNKPPTRILMDPCVSSEGPSIIYTHNTYSSIKSKCGLARKHVRKTK